jgi:glucose-1-phosphate thymidylyltransferase
MLVGLLPAAGKGVRLRPFRSPKELFPLLLRGEADDVAIPAPVCSFSIEAMRLAGVDRCLAVISDEKLELVRVLGDGSNLGVNLGYIVQTEARGLTHVVRIARPWLRDADVIFALPDTVLFPRHALAELHTARVAAKADLALGVFPTHEPERLAPVEIAADGRVLAIHDKPAVAPAKNTWGVLSWSARFTDFCAEWDADRSAESEGILSHAMEAARAAGYPVIARVFEDGVFRDVGTPEGLASTMRLLMERGLVFTGE